MAEEKVVVKNLYKIFGPNPEQAFSYLEQGMGKTEIFEKTGLTVGVMNANFSVYKGEVFVVMGLSGSGKSTLVRMLNRLIEPTSGQVLVDGNDVAHMSKDELIKLRRNDMSMVFQSFALLPHMTVEANAAFGLEVAGYPPKERRKRALQALEQVGLRANARSFPGELSGGMQQRVGLARALAHNPTIMLMDEAFSALDPLIRSEMQDELLKLQEESERTVIFISHDLDEAMRIGDRIAMMEGGRIVQIGTPDEILKNPADEYVRSFFRGVDPTTVLHAGDIARDNQVTLIRHKGEGLRAALEQLRGQDREFGYVLDKQKRYQGVVSVDSLLTALQGTEQKLEQKRYQGVVTVDTLTEAYKGAEKTLEDAFLEDVEPVKIDTPLQEVLPIITKASCPVPVVNDDYMYVGAISKNRFLKTLDRGVE